MPCERVIDGPLAVIGDVHGQLDLLDSVLDKLRTLDDFHDRWIVFIGDLVDRGVDSSGVIQRIIDLQAEHGKVTCVMGNHELAMGFATGILPNGETTDWDHRWCSYYGAEATFASYGAMFPDCDHLRDSLPEAHVEFLQELPWAVEHPEFYFVHAGLDPGQSFELQKRILEERDFSLHRPIWLCSKDFANGRVPADCDATIVSGHVPFEEVQAWPNRILIDTTGGVEGDLSCVLLPERILITSNDDLDAQESADDAVYAEGPNAGHAAADRYDTRGGQDQARPKWYQFWK